MVAVTLEAARALTEADAAACSPRPPPTRCTVRESFGLEGRCSRDELRQRAETAAARAADAGAPLRSGLDLFAVPLTARKSPEGVMVVQCLDGRPPTRPPRRSLRPRDARGRGPRAAMSVPRPATASSSSRSSTRSGRSPNSVPDLHGTLRGVARQIERVVPYHRLNFAFYDDVHRRDRPAPRVRRGTRPRPPAPAPRGTAHVLVERHADGAAPPHPRYPRELVPAHSRAGGRGRAERGQRAHGAGRPVLRRPQRRRKPAGRLHGRPHRVPGITQPAPRAGRRQGQAARRASGTAGGTHARRGGAPSGQGGGRDREPGKERVPGQHEPRDPHAHERRHRDDRVCCSTPR